MTPKKRRRLYFAAAVVLASGGAAWLVLGALKDNVVYFHSPSEMAELHVQPGIAFRIGGLVADHSVTHGSGAETRFTAVYIDGVRIDSQATGGAPWEAIPLAQIDRIEVLRGPAAAVYGSDAIGGVVQFFTRKGEGKPTPYVNLGAGSRSLRHAEAGVSGAAGDFDYSIGTAYEESKGFNVRPVDGANPDRDSHRSLRGRVRLSPHRLDHSERGPPL